MGPEYSFLRCDCGWEGPEADLITVCLDHGTRETPPEYTAECPACCGDWENMEELDIED